MNYLLYGADTYRSRQKLNAIIAEYRRKSGSDLNVHRFNAEAQDLSELERIAEAGSLFAPKKLIAVDQALAAEGFAAVLHLAERCNKSSDTIVVLRHPEPDEAVKKRLAELKPHLTSAQEFRPLADLELSQWIREEAKSRNVTLGPREKVRMALLGKNLWAIANELDKMALEPRQAGIEAASAQRESTIFDLGDAFFSSPRLGLRHLVELLYQGEDEFSLFSYLANHSRILLTVKAYAAAGRPVPASYRIHPYVIKKASHLIGALSPEQLRVQVEGFFAEDVKIKTGAAKPAESLLRLLLR